MASAEKIAYASPNCLRTCSREDLRECSDCSSWERPAGAPGPVTQAHASTSVTTKARPSSVSDITTTACFHMASILPPSPIGVWRRNDRLPRTQVEGGHLRAVADEEKPVHQRRMVERASL